MQQNCKNNLLTIKKLLLVLDANTYFSALPIFSGASFGQHIRHILEFYGCLLAAETTVNYDLRERNLSLERDKQAAIEYIDYICGVFEREEMSDKAILLEGDCCETAVTTSLQRELLYCLEHSIHHQALIKMGLIVLNLQHLVGSEFGVAPSTIRFYSQK